MEHNENIPAKKERSVWWTQHRAAIAGALRRVPGRVGRWVKANFGVKPARALSLFKNGLITQNPTLVLLLGMCSTLAVSTSLQNAVGMGIAATVVLTCSNVLIALLRNIIPPQVRIACYVVVIAGFTTIVDLCIQAFVRVLADSLGIFIPLIVVNCIILARAEAFASKNTPGYAAVDGIAMGLGYTAALAVLGSIREILGSGTIAGIPLFGANYMPVMLVVMPCGGFVLLGMLIACMQWLRKRDWKKKKKEGAAT